MPKFSYTSGEKISCFFRYSIKKPYYATKFSVRLIAKEKRTTGYGKDRRTQLHTIADAELPLSGEVDLVPGKEYANEFEVLVPQVSSGPGSEAMQTIARVASVMSNSHSRVY